MSEKKTEEKRKSRSAMITWAVLTVLCVLFFYTASRFILFPDRYKVPLFIVLAVMAGLCGLPSFLGRKKAVNIFSIIVNCVLSAALAVGSLYLPHLEKQLKGVFKEQKDTEEVKINVYAFSADYKKAHPEVSAHAVNPDKTPEDISAYGGSTFLIQDSVDQKNQSKAVEEIAEAAGVQDIHTVHENTIWDEVKAFYDGTGELMVLDAAYVPVIEEQPVYSSFSGDTVLVHQYTGSFSSGNKKKEVSSDLVTKPFTLYIAGSDSRDEELTSVTRTDVNIMLTVDPVNQTVLEVGVPRDAYIPNPGLSNGLDKLTHLGMLGIDNTLSGISSYFNIPFSNYVLVNFNTYSTIIDALDGIEIDNPYEFTTVGGNGGGDYTFPQGRIHLDGEMALSYVRERYNLPEGDMGRSEHQLIVLQGIINKMTGKEMMKHYSEVLDALQDKFLTNLDSDDIYALAEKAVSGGDCNVVKYRLQERDDTAETASAPGEELYVGWLYDSQVQFVEEQMSDVLNRQKIVQKELPEGVSAQ